MNSNIKKRLTKFEKILIPDFNQMTDTELENWCKLYPCKPEYRLKRELELSAMSDDELLRIIGKSDAK